MSKKAVCVSLEDKIIKAVDLYSQSMGGMSKSAVVSVSLLQYFLQNSDFRKNPKVRKLLKDEIELYEKK